MQTCNIMGVNIAVTDMDKTLRLVEDNCEGMAREIYLRGERPHHRDGPRRPDLSAGAERRGHGPAGRRAAVQIQPQERALPTPPA